MDDLVELFIRDLPGRLAELEGQWARGEHDAVRSQAHLIAGSATMYGLGPIALAARALEQCLIAGEGVDGSPAVGRRVDRLVSVCQEMIGSE